MRPPRLAFGASSGVLPERSKALIGAMLRLSAFVWLSLDVKKSCTPSTVGIAIGGSRPGCTGGSVGSSSKSSFFRGVGADHCCDAARESGRG